MTAAIIPCFGDGVVTMFGDMPSLIFDYTAIIPLTQHPDAIGIFHSPPRLS
jgi:hypothetical protein